MKVEEQQLSVVEGGFDGEAAARGRMKDEL
jgi:hypothetical protein